jgi:hypothetical protein
MARCPWRYSIIRAIALSSTFENASQMLPRECIRRRAIGSQAASNSSSWLPGICDPWIRQNSGDSSNPGMG